MPLFDFSELHEQAKNTFEPFEAKLTSYPCGNFGCPWLEAQTRHHGKAPDGLMLMQDWGIVEDEEELQLTVDAVRKILSTETELTDDHDPTQKKLLGGGWARHIRSGSWWVSNAVWALRKTSRKSGYLGDTVHRRAFPIWLEVVSRLAAQKKDFHLVVAGAWARFDHSKTQEPSLREYLLKWAKWSCGRNASRDELERLTCKAVACNGRVWYMDHPSIWSSQNLQKGPPDGTM